MGCASPVIEKDGGATLGVGGGDDAGGEAVPAIRPQGHAEPPLGEDMMSLDEMIEPYKCSDFDRYGEEVTAIQVALYMKLPKDFGMQISLREFTMGRLFSCLRKESCAPCAGNVCRPF